MRVFGKIIDDNNLKWLLLALCVLTVLIRLPVYIWSFSWVESPDALGEYLYVADRVLKEGVQEGLPGSQYALGKRGSSLAREIVHPLILALSKYLSPSGIKRPYCLIAIFIDVITLLCIFKLATYFSGNRVCQLLAATLFAIYPVAIKASAHQGALRESWVACFVAVTLMILLSLIQKPSIKKIIALGVPLSGLYLYNNSFLLFVIVVLLWLFILFVFHPIFKNTLLSRRSTFVSLFLISVLSLGPASYVAQLFSKDGYRTSIYPHQMFWAFLHNRGLVATYGPYDPKYMINSATSSKRYPQITNVYSKSPWIMGGLHTIKDYGFFKALQVICANICRLVWFPYNELATRLYISFKIQIIFHQILMVLALIGVLLNLARAKLEGYIMFSLLISVIFPYALVYAWSRYAYQVIPLLIPFTASVFEALKLLPRKKNNISFILLGLSGGFFLAANILVGAGKYVTGVSAFLFLLLTFWNIGIKVKTQERNSC